MMTEELEDVRTSELGVTRKLHRYTLSLVLQIEQHPKSRGGVKSKAKLRPSVEHWARTNNLTGGSRSAGAETCALAILATATVVTQHSA
jgi:hypothetical protein